MKILTNWPGAGLNSKFSYPHINVSPTVKGDSATSEGDATSAIALNQEHYWIKICIISNYISQFKNACSKKFCNGSFEHWKLFSFSIP